MSEYVANGNMYECSYTFSNPYSNIHTEPFRTSVNDLYYCMLQKCLNRHREYELHETNPLSVVLCNDAYYFNDSKVIRRIDKYESS